jgi:hypothetical protein
VRPIYESEIFAFQQVMRERFEAEIPLRDRLLRPGQYLVSEKKRLPTPLPPFHFFLDLHKICFPHLEMK